MKIIFLDHAGLNEKKPAQEFDEGSQWHNSGGERTWLAPTADFFFPEFPSLETYFQQRSLDPGRYIVSRSNGSLRWTNPATLTMSRAEQAVELRISKSLSPAHNPLRHDRVETDSAVKYGGYTIRTRLDFNGPGSPPEIGLWDLIQLPHGGDMLVPTVSFSQPKFYMGSISGRISWSMII